MNQIKRFAPIVLFIVSIIMIGIRASDTISKPLGINLSDDVIKWEPRIQSLREFLPDDVNQVGYLDQSMITEGSLFDGEEFFLMQYSVAPIALEAGFKKDWIIGNFSDDSSLKPWLDKHIKKYEIQNFGFGLYLIHKLEK